MGSAVGKIEASLVAVAIGSGVELVPEEESVKVGVTVPFWQAANPPMPKRSNNMLINNVVFRFILPIILVSNQSGTLLRWIA